MQASRAGDASGGKVGGGNAATIDATYLAAWFRGKEFSNNGDLHFGIHVRDNRIDFSTPVEELPGSLEEPLTKCVIGCGQSEAALPTVLPNTCSAYLIKDTNQQRVLGEDSAFSTPLYFANFGSRPLRFRQVLTQPPNATSGDHDSTELVVQPNTVSTLGTQPSGSKSQFDKYTVFVDGNASSIGSREGFAVFRHLSVLQQIREMSHKVMDGTLSKKKMKRAAKSLLKTLKNRPRKRPFGAMESSAGKSQKSSAKSIPLPEHLSAKARHSSDGCLDAAQKLPEARFSAACQLGA